jgi:hypothetical protein
MAKAPVSGLIEKYKRGEADRRIAEISKSFHCDEFFLVGVCVDARIRGDIEIFVGRRIPEEIPPRPQTVSCYEKVEVGTRCCSNLRIPRGEYGPPLPYNPYVPSISSSDPRPPWRAGQAP